MKTSNNKGRPPKPPTAPRFASNTNPLKEILDTTITPTTSKFSSSTALPPSSSTSTSSRSSSSSTSTKSKKRKNKPSQKVPQGRQRNRYYRTFEKVKCHYCTVNNLPCTGGTPCHQCVALEQSKMGYPPELSFLIAKDKSDPTKVEKKKLYDKSLRTKSKKMKAVVENFVKIDVAKEEADKKKKKKKQKKNNKNENDRETGDSDEDVEMDNDWDLDDDEDDDEEEEDEDQGVGDDDDDVDATNKATDETISATPCKHCLKAHQTCNLSKPTCGRCAQLGLECDYEISHYEQRKQMQRERIANERELPVNARRICVPYRVNRDFSFDHCMKIYGGSMFADMPELMNRLMQQELIADRQRMEVKENGEVHDRTFHLTQLRKDKKMLKARGALEEPNKKRHYLF